MAGDCPECGLKVVRSLRGNLLIYSDPVYVKRLARGAMMVELGVVTLCAVPILGIVGAVLLLSLNLPQILLDVGSAVAALLGIAAGVLGLVGLFVLTARDPAFVGQDESDRSRLAARIATVLCAVCWAGGAMVSALPTLAATAPVAFAILLRGAGFALLIAICVQTIASALYMRHLAIRLRDAQLRDRLTSLKSEAVTLAACVGITVLLSFSRWGACFSLVGGLLGLLLFLVFITHYAGAVDRLRQELALAAEAAS
jgi:hypothetical protein